MPQKIFWLHGASGRMGRALQDVAAESPDVELRAIELRATDQRESSARPPAAQAMIDFSLPQGLLAAIEFALEARIPLISGTTGGSAEVEAALERASRLIPVLHAQNFSVGLAAMRQAAGMLAARLDWDCELVEAHHRGKRDAPSGTALSLIEAVRRGRGEHAPWSERIAASSRGESRAAGSIGVASLRGGSVVGDHSLQFLGEGERVVLSHHAEDRRIFARGALLAARRIIELPAGRYGFEQVLWPT